MPEQLPLIAEERIEPTLRMVDISRIVYTEHPYSDAFAESIRSHGVLQSVILVQGRGREAMYEVVDGRRRIKAAAMTAGMTRVPALVYPPNTPAALLDAITVEANVHRSGNPIAEMWAIRSMVFEGGNDYATVARRLGMTVRAVEQRMRMIDLPTVLLEAIEAGRLKVSVARQILGLASETRARLVRLYEDRQVLELGGESTATITLHDVREARNWEQSQVASQQTSFVDEFAPQTPTEHAVADLSQPQSTLQGMLGIDLATGEDRTVAQHAVTIARNERMDAGVWRGPDGILYYDQSWVDRERVRIALFEPNDLTVIPIRPADGQPLGVFVEPDGELFYTGEFVQQFARDAVARAERRFADRGDVITWQNDGMYISGTGDRFVPETEVASRASRAFAEMGGLPTDRVIRRAEGAGERAYYDPATSERFISESHADEMIRELENSLRQAYEESAPQAVISPTEPVFHEESWQSVVARLELVREVMPASPDDESDRVATVYEFLLNRARDLARA